MAGLRNRSMAIATGGIVLVCGAWTAPALAYPPTITLSIVCTPGTVSPGATFTCTLDNINPSGPNDIVLGGQIAQGGAVLSRADFATQAATQYTEQLTAPSTPGTYEVVGTSAGEAAMTTITVRGGSSTGTGGTGTGTSAGLDGSATPETGANLALGLTSAFAALAVGAGLYFASRRKRV